MRWWVAKLAAAAPGSAAPAETIRSATVASRIRMRGRKHGFAMQHKTRNRGGSRCWPRAGCRTDHDDALRLRARSGHRLRLPPEGRPHRQREEAEGRVLEAADGRRASPVR